MNCVAVKVWRQQVEINWAYLALLLYFAALNINIQTVTVQGGHESFDKSSSV